MAFVPTTDRGGAAATAAPEHRPWYTDPVPLPDVMFDQLEYLLTHGRQGCPAHCVDCARLERVKYWLLVPFQSVTHRVC